MAYERHEWYGGEVITSEKLNNIEQGIEEASASGGGADWNAVEGETGYIANKPFGTATEETILFDGDVVFKYGTWTDSDGNSYGEDGEYSVRINLNVPENYNAEKGQYLLNISDIISNLEIKIYDYSTDFYCEETDKFNISGDIGSSNNLYIAYYDSDYVDSDPSELTRHVTFKNVVKNVKQLNPIYQNQVDWDVLDKTSNLAIKNQPFGGFDNEGYFGNSCSVTLTKGNIDGTYNYNGITSIDNLSGLKPYKGLKFIIDDCESEFTKFDGVSFDTGYFGNLDLQYQIYYDVADYNNVYIDVKSAKDLGETTDIGLGFNIYEPIIKKIAPIYIPHIIYKIKNLSNGSTANFSYINIVEGNSPIELKAYDLYFLEYITQLMDDNGNIYNLVNVGTSNSRPTYRYIKYNPSIEAPHTVTVTEFTITVNNPSSSDGATISNYSEYTIGNTN